MPTTDCLTVDSLYYSINSQKLLEDISFVFARPQKIALVGLNGAGKSTLLQLLAGSLTPASGQLDYSNRSATSLDIKSVLGYQSANMQDLPQMTVAEYLRWVARLKGVNKIADRIKSIAEYWSLDSLLTHSLSTLSQGNLQKVMVAQAFVNRPEIVLLDEPSQALDPVAQQLLIDNLKALDSATLCIFTSHHINEMVEVADQVLLLDGGRLIAQINITDPEEFWFTLAAQQSLPADLQSQASLVAKGSRQNLYCLQNQTNKGLDLEQILGGINHQLLGSGKQALLPLFGLLANGAF